MVIDHILNHRYPIPKHVRHRRVIVWFRKHITQHHWFHALYHNLFSHRIIGNSGYEFCEFCNYHQERFMDRLMPVFSGNE
jgi:hypothetical protein